MNRLILSVFLCCIAITGYTSPPPAADVFKFSTKIMDQNTLILIWDIKSGYFLYKDRFHFTKGQHSAFQLGAIHYPEAGQKTDHQGKRIPIYREKTLIPLSVLGNTAGESKLDVGYQGCADDGFCYPPETKSVTLSFNDAGELISAVRETSSDTAIKHETFIQSHDEFHELFYTHNWLIIFISFFGFGLLLSFTPCVLPMIPVLSGIILGQGKKLSTHKSFLLSLSYILSMATTYAIIGAVVALMGSNLQVWMQNPWAISLFSLIFFLLALSMFEFYDLRLPNAWQSKLTKLSHSKAGGYYLGSAIMGCLSTLILSPCVTAPLFGALGYIANTGDVARGSLTLFFMGLGMGTPLLLIGTSAGKWVPKTGEWMHTIKAFFGLLLLAVAIQLLSRVLPPVLTMGLWASLLIFTGIYSGALEHAKTNQDKFRQGVGIIALVYGVLILIGASQGSHNPLQPLVQSSTTTPAVDTNHFVVTSLPALTQTLNQIKGRPVLLDFYADWCESCKHMEATTFMDPEVKHLLQQVVMIKVDVSANDNDAHTLMRKYGIIAPPALLFYNKDGEENHALQLSGDIGSALLIQRLETLLDFTVLSKPS